MLGVYDQDLSHSKVDGRENKTAWGEKKKSKRETYHGAFIDTCSHETEALVLRDTIGRKEVNVDKCATQIS
jgi:hypothetical protein